MNTLYWWVYENLESLTDGVYTVDSFNNYILKDGDLFKVNVRTNNETRAITVSSGKVVKCEDDAEEFKDSIRLESPEDAVYWKQVELVG